MKFTFSWLQKFLKTKRSLKDICEKLTLLGIEVSEIIDNQDVLKPFKIAQVVDVKDHPNADRLKLCKINEIARDRRLHSQYTFGSNLQPATCCT